MLAKDDAHEGLAPLAQLGAGVTWSDVRPGTDGVLRIEIEPTEPDARMTDLAVRRIGALLQVHGARVLQKDVQARGRCGSRDPAPKAKRSAAARDLTKRGKMRERSRLPARCNAQRATRASAQTSQTSPDRAKQCSAARS